MLMINLKKASSVFQKLNLTGITKTWELLNLQVVPFEHIFIKISYEYYNFSIS